MFDLTDRAAVITGAAGGIGSATAVAFAGQGADVLLAVAPGEGDAGQSCRQVSRSGAAAVVEADMRSTDAVEGIVAARSRSSAARHRDRQRRNRARDPVRRHRRRAVGGDVDTNLGGARRCFRAALPTMVEAGWGG